MWRNSPCRSSKKTITAVVHCKQGSGLIKMNGQPLEMIMPGMLQYSSWNLFVSGQGAICCGHPSPREGWWSRDSDLHNHNWPLHLQSPGGYYQKYKDEAVEKEIKDLRVQYNQTLLVAVSQCCESKKFEGPGTCACYQKSYR